MQNENETVVEGVEEVGTDESVRTDNTANYADSRTEEEKKEDNAVEAVVTTSNDEVVKEDEKVAEEVNEEPQQAVFKGDVIEITPEVALELREEFNSMHRRHRGEVVIGNLKIVCKG